MRTTSATSKTQEQDRPLSGTGVERRRDERRPGVVEREGGGEEKAQQVRQNQEDDSGLNKGLQVSDALDDDSRACHIRQPHHLFLIAITSIGQVSSLSEGHQHGPSLGNSSATVSLHCVTVVTFMCCRYNK